MTTSNTKTSGFALNRENQLPPLDEKTLTRFKNRVWISEQTTCWIWCGARNESGYGRLRINKCTFLAHRISYLIENETIPEWCQVILHTCDNPACVNPSHLIAATINDNVHDRNSKGRQARGQKSGRRKLSAEDVLQLRSRYKRRIVTLKSLANEYGITLDQAHRAITGKSWRHLK